MTVAEQIAKLQKMPSDAICVINGEFGQIEVTQVCSLSKKDRINMRLPYIPDNKKVVYLYGRNY